jgi:hypothetical protein
VNKSMKKIIQKILTIGNLNFSRKIFRNSTQFFYVFLTKKIFKFLERTNDDKKNLSINSKT